MATMRAKHTCVRKPCSRPKRRIAVFRTLEPSSKVIGTFDLDNRRYLCMMLGRATPWEGNILG